MAETVYLLCGITSVACTVLLLRAYLENKSKLLFWSSLCFGGLALNNVLLFVDLVIVPTADLGVLRSLLAVLAMMTLLFGLVWEHQ
jgi:hypothetical protein